MFVRRLTPLVALVAALAAPLSADAQNAPAPDAAASTAPVMQGQPEHRGHHTSLWHALRTVDLSAAQRQQIEAIHQQAKTANLNADEATRRANNAKTRAAVMAVLTPEQRTQVLAAMHRPNTERTSTDAGAPVPTPTP